MEVGDIRGVADHHLGIASRCGPISLNSYTVYIMANYMKVNGILIQLYLSKCVFCRYPFTST